MIPFQFSSGLIKYPLFSYAQLSPVYLIWVTCWIAGAAGLRFAIPKHTEWILIGTIVGILAPLSPPLLIYLVAVPIIVFHIGRNRLTPQWHWPVIWGVWGLSTIIIPWTALVWHPEWDFIRLFFLHTTGFRTGPYLYDTIDRGHRFSLKETLIYFLFPGNFLVIPTWIVWPFPSECKLIRHRDPVAERSIPQYIIGLTCLMTVWGINSAAIRLTGHPVGTTIADWTLVGTFSRIIESLTRIIYYYFVATIGMSIAQTLGYRFEKPAFNHPWKTQNPYDFWNRFLIHTKDVYLKLFLQPMELIFRHIGIRSIKVRFGLAIMVSFFVIEIPIHFFAVYDHSMLHFPLQLWQWYFFLLGTFGLYWVGRTLIHPKIRAWAHHPVGHRAISIFWITLFLMAV